MCSILHCNFLARWRRNRPSTFVSSLCGFSFCFPLSSCILKCGIPWKFFIVFCDIRLPYTYYTFITHSKWYRSCCGKGSSWFTESFDQNRQFMSGVHALRVNVIYYQYRNCCRKRFWWITRSFYETRYVSSACARVTSETYPWGLLVNSLTEVALWKICIIIFLLFFFFFFFF